MSQTIETTDVDTSMQAAWKDFAQGRSVTQLGVVPAFMRHMMLNQRDLLIKWLLQRAPSLISEQFGAMDRSDAAMEVVHRKESVFKQMAEALQEEPEVEKRKQIVAERRSGWRSVYVVSADGKRKTVSAMTAADHEFVSGRRDETARHLLFEAALHRALARRLSKLGPDATTADLYTEEEYEQVEGNVKQAIYGKSSLTPEIEA